MAENILSISLKDYKKQIEELKGSLLNLQKGSEAYEKVLEEVRSRQDKLNQVLSDTKKDAAAADGSVKQMRQTLSELKKQWAETADEMERKNLGKTIKKLQDNLNDLHKSIGDYRYNIGNYANSFGEALEKVGIGFGGVITSATAAGAAIKKAFEKNPYLMALAAVIGVIAGAFKLLKGAIEGNAETAKKWKVAMAALQPITNAVKNVVDKLASAFVNVISTVTGKFPQIYTTIGNVSNKVMKAFASVVKAVSYFADGITFLPNLVYKVFNPVVDTILNAVKSIAGGLGNLLDAVGLDDLAGKLNGVVSKVADGMSGFNHAMQKGLENSGKTMREWANSIEEAGKITQNSMQSAADSTRQTVRLEEERQQLNRDIKKQMEESAASELKQANLRRQIAKSEGEERKKLLKELQAEIEKNGKREIELAQRRYDIMKEEHTLTPNSAEDNLNLLNAKIAITNAETNYLSALVKSDKQLEKLEASENSANSAAKNRAATSKKAAEEAKKALEEEKKIIDAYVKTINDSISWYKEEHKTILEVATAQGKMTKLDADKKRLDLLKEIVAQRDKEIETLRANANASEQLVEAEKQRAREVAEYEIAQALYTRERIEAVYKASINTINDNYKYAVQQINNRRTLADAWFDLGRTGTANDIVALNDIGEVIIDGIQSLAEKTVKAYNQYGKIIEPAKELFIKGLADVEKEKLSEPLAFIEEKLNGFNKNTASLSDDFIDDYFRRWNDAIEIAKTLGDELEKTLKSEFDKVDLLPSLNPTDYNYSLQKFIDILTTNFNTIYNTLDENRKEDLKKNKSSLDGYLISYKNFVEETKGYYDELTDAGAEIEKPFELWYDTMAGSVAIGEVLNSEFKMMRGLIDDITNNLDGVTLEKIFGEGKGIGLKIDEYLETITKYIKDVPEAQREYVIAAANHYDNLMMSYFGKETQRKMTNNILEFLNGTKVVIDGYAPKLEEAMKNVMSALKNVSGNQKITDTMNKQLKSEMTVLSSIVEEASKDIKAEYKSILDSFDSGDVSVEKIGTFLENLKNHFLKKYSELRDVLSSNNDEVRKLIDELYTKAISATNVKAEYILPVDTLKQTLNEVPKEVAEIFDKITNDIDISAIIDKTLEGQSDKTKKAVQKFLNQTFDEGEYTKALNKLPKATQNIIKEIKKNINDADATNYEQNFKLYGDAVKLLEEYIAKQKEIASSNGKSFDGGWLKGIVDSYKSAQEMMTSDTEETFEKIADVIYNGFDDKIEIIPESLIDRFENIKSIIGSMRMSEDGYDANDVKNLSAEVKSFVENLKSVSDSQIEAATRVISDVPKKFDEAISLINKIFEDGNNKIAKNSDEFRSSMLVLRTSLEDEAAQVPEKLKPMYETLMTDFDRYISGLLDGKALTDKVSDFMGAWKQSVGTINYGTGDLINEEGSSTLISNKTLDELKKNISKFSAADMAKFLKDELAKMPDYLKPEVENMLLLYRKLFMNDEDYNELRDNLVQRLSFINKVIQEMDKAGIGQNEDKYIEMLKSRTDIVNELEDKKTEHIAQQAAIINEIRENQNKAYAKQVEFTKKKINDEIKAYFNLASSVSSIFGSVSEIMEENINQKVKSGKISEEEAEKEFERVKAFQIGEAVINTLSGALGAFMNDKKAFPFPYNYIVATADMAATLATGIAQIQKIKNTTYGNGSTSSLGGSTGSALGQNSPVVDPLLNETLDYNTMLSLDEYTENKKQREQRVVILQSDIHESEQQVKVRQNQSTF